MFEECHKCASQGGLQCKDDYASLKPGYWWKWSNQTYKERYLYFIKNLLASPPLLDDFSVQYPYPIPTPYKCPVEKSCEGGLDSPCQNGYEGPLCAVCSTGYFKQLQICTPCPSKRWIVGQLSIVMAVLLAIIAFLVWTNKRNSKKGEGRQLIDMFFSKLKIVIGFYQVTYGLLEAFSYIKWPGSLQVIAKYSGILQMDFLQIAPIHCIFPGLHVDAFGNLLVIMSMNAAVIGISGLVFGIRKAIILNSKNCGEVEKLGKVSQAKETAYRNLFFFLYVTYLSTCSKTASVLPLACRKICSDEKEEFCYKYLKADYSVECQGQRYSNLVILGYISTAYILALPVTSFFALWRQRRLISVPTKTDSSGSNTEIITGLRFLFENYKTHSWYWELVEMSRKVILTTGLILVGQESRSYIGLAWVMAGMYGMLFSWVKPIQEAFENRLMSASLAVTVVNLGIGAVSRIPAENIPGAINSDTDAVVLKILVIGANSLVIILVIAQYAMYLYGYLKEWRKNPHCSFSCCLAVFLPLQDLQGELSGLIGTNLLHTRLNTGVEMPTVFAAVKDSGAIDITLEDDTQDDTKAVDLQDESLSNGEYNSPKCHQGSQTEFSWLAEADVVLHVPIERTQQKSLWQCTRL
ncbi:uncharacterized protein LOC144636032 [Oculina patagonica]